MSENGLSRLARRAGAALALAGSAIVAWLSSALLCLLSCGRQRCGRLDKEKYNVQDDSVSYTSNANSTHCVHHGSPTAHLDDPDIDFRLASPHPLPHLGAPQPDLVAHKPVGVGADPQTYDPASEKIFHIADGSASTSPNLDRNQLRFTTSLGRGWFGWVVEGQLRRPQSGLLENVVVQVLKEEASTQEQIRFLEASQHGSLLVNGARPGQENVLRLVGSCTDTLPYLQVFEVCAFGDLKTFLSVRADQIPLLQEEGLVLKFCQQITSGVAKLHQLGIIPGDLAARTCMVTSDVNVKVGDYGLAPKTFLEDYVPLYGESQPVRWMPPEILRSLHHAGERDSEDSGSEDRSSVVLGPSETGGLWTPASGIWPLAVTLWEVMTFGERPFDSVSDNQFVKTALAEPLVLARNIGRLRVMGVEAEAIQSVITLCLKPRPEDRPSCDRLDSYITDLYEGQMEERARATGARARATGAGAGAGAGEDSLEAGPAPANAPDLIVDFMVAV